MANQNFGQLSFGQLVICLKAPVVQLVFCLIIWSPAEATQITYTTHPKNHPHVGLTKKLSKADLEGDSRPTFGLSTKFSKKLFQDMKQDSSDFSCQKCNKNIN